MKLSPKKLAQCPILIAIWNLDRLALHKFSCVVKFIIKPEFSHFLIDRRTTPTPSLFVLFNFEICKSSFIVNRYASRKPTNTKIKSYLLRLQSLIKQKDAWPGPDIRSSILQLGPWSLEEPCRDTGVSNSRLRRRPKFSLTHCQLKRSDSAKCPPNLFFPATNKRFKLGNDDDSLLISRSLCVKLMLISCKLGQEWARRSTHSSDRDG